MSIINPFTPSNAHVRKPQFTSERNFNFTGLALLKDFLPFPAVIAIGALLGATFASFSHRIPYISHIHPALLVGGVVSLYPIRAVLTWIGVLRNSRLKNVISGSYTARIPGSIEGVGSPEFAVVLLTIRNNSPIGLFDKDFQWIARDFNKMIRELQEKDEWGLMNNEAFISAQRGSGNTLLNVLYFKTTDHLLRWVRQGLHQSVWMKVARDSVRYAHIELAHELFTVKEGGYESIYFNHEPRGLADSYEFVPNVEGGKEGVWQSNLRWLKKASRSTTRMEGKF